LNKKSYAGQVVYYTSDLLDKAGINHGFFTRLGGVSKDQFYALNFKKGLGDSDKNVDKNRQLACQSIKVNEQKLTFAKLVHGNRIHTVGLGDAGQDINDVDCLLTLSAGIPIAISVADCLPIIVAHPLKKVVAVIHGGWRSLVAEIIPKTIQQITSSSRCLPSDLIAAIGPGIGVDSYPVGKEVIAAVQNIIEEPSKILPLNGNNTHLDLRGLAQTQLLKTGLNKIDQIDIDTATNTAEFYSYRAEGNTGRFGTIVSL
jgi:YfiH family protein